MKGYAIIENEHCTLFTKDADAVLPTRKDWPQDWPGEVSPEFLKDQGFRVLFCRVSDWWLSYLDFWNRHEFEKSFAELETSRNKQAQRVKAMQAHVTRLKRTHQQLTQHESDYPTPLPPTEPITVFDSARIPTFSGCYFAWLGPLVQYVGKAVNLRSRLRPSHHAIQPDHVITWVPIPESELYFAEAYYIGTMRPRLNSAKPPVPRTC